MMGGNSYTRNGNIIAFILVKGLIPDEMCPCACEGDLDDAIMKLLIINISFMNKSNDRWFYFVVFP